MKKEIILNSKKLNFIQKWYFKRNTKTVERIKKIYFNLSVVSIIIAIFMTKFSIALMISGVTLLALYYVMNEKMANPILFTDAIHVASQEEIKKFIKEKKLMTHEELKNILYKSHYSEGDVRLEIMKKSNGHESIDKIKQIMAQDVPSMVPYAKIITDEMIKSVLKDYSENNNPIKLPKEALNIKSRTTETLKEWYKTALGFEKTDNFKEKSVQTKTRDSLIKFIESNFLKLENA